MKSLNTKLFIFPIFFYLFFFANFLLAQGTTCQGGKLTTPDVFRSYVKQSFLQKIYQRRIAIPVESVSEICWFVYSDRDRNELQSLNGSHLGYLSYLEKCTVKEVNQDKLLVESVDDDTKQGWVKAKFLILSDIAAVLNERGSTKKAMILTTVTDLDPTRMKEYQEQLRQMYFYSSPANGIRPNGKLAKKFEIYFVLKETDDKILLSRSDKLVGSSVQLTSVVLGWFPKSNITEWDHRVCWEIGYGRELANEYNDREVLVFAPGTVERDGARYLREYLLNGVYSASARNMIKRMKIPVTRLNPRVMRMPVLEHDSENTRIKKIASIASIDGFDSERMRAEITEKIANLKKKVESVNILFVVDATQSMHDYFPSISRSIREIITRNEDLGTTANLRFGIAIYRDYPDANNGRDFEHRALEADSNISDLLNFIGSVNCSSTDNDVPEAQYQGLVKGIQQAGFEKQASNIVVLIGDAGNHNNDLKYAIQDVVREMTNYEISFLAFQVISNSSEEYMKFNFDAQDFINESAKHYLKANERSTLKFIEDEKGIENTFKLVFNNNEESDTYRMFGRFTYASAGKMMNTQILVENIKHATNEYIDKLQFKLRDLENAISGNSSLNGSFTSEFTEYLKRMGFTEDQIIMLTRLGDVSSSGYTSSGFYSIDEPCFKPVVFISNIEREQLNTTFDKLLKHVVPSKRKLNFAKSLIEIAEKMLGSSEDEVKNLTLDEVWDIVLGVPFEGFLELKNMKLRDMSDIDDALFDKFYEKFKQKAIKFKESEFMNSRFEVGNSFFYWIPLDEFPGN